MSMVGDIVGVVGGIIDKIIPDPAQAAAAKLALFQAQQEGKLDEAKISLSAIITEAQSTDPWTSRARPSFLYVIYTLILAALPMGALFAFRPEVANAVISGFHNWLAATPDTYLQLFGVGYLGYTGAKSFDAHSENKYGKAKK